MTNYVIVETMLRSIGPLLKEEKSLGSYAGGWVCEGD